MKNIITRKERLARKSGGQKLKPMNQELPSKWEMLKNLVGAAKDAIAGGLDVRSPEDTEKALKICAECPLLAGDEQSPRCGSCGCFLGAVETNPDGSKRTRFGKVFFSSWHCPLGKW